MAPNTPDIDTLLGGISAEQFLKDYWQRRPRLINQAWPGIRASITPEELAGLACEAEVNSRLVSNAANNWSVINGPHSESTFTELGETNWSLLVPDCEKFLPGLQHLLDPFKFIPSWRIDDLMISYATDGGGVGPHIDEYDVFLLQLEGKRHWQIDPKPEDTKLRDAHELAILENFNARQSWTLDAGDMLYLPPGVAHNGVADGACLTASIGFRAPLANNLAMEFANHLPPARYKDKNLKPAKRPAELTDAMLAALAESIQELFAGQSKLPHWAGEFLTTSSAQIPTLERALSISDFKLALANDTGLIKSAWSKFLYHRSATELTLFADAVSFPIGINYLSQIQMICDSHNIQFEQADLNSEELSQLLYDLYLQGTLILDT